MNDLSIKSRMENDRCWPVPKSMTREQQADELTRDAMFRSWNFIGEEDHGNLKDMLGEVINIIWRDKSLKDDSERVTEIRQYILGFIEVWAERKAEGME